MFWQIRKRPNTCCRCNSPDLLAKDCTFCINCDSIGQVSKQCPSNVKCCICKEESHKAIDRQLSWSWCLPSQCSPDPEPASFSVALVPGCVNLFSHRDNETVTSNLLSIMNFQWQEDDDVPASILDVLDDADDGYTWCFRHPRETQFTCFNADLSIASRLDSFSFKFSYHLIISYDIFPCTRSGF